jgi:hypothetical protein
MNAEQAASVYLSRCKIGDRPRWQHIRLYLPRALRFLLTIRDYQNYASIHILGVCKKAAGVPRVCPA